MRLDLLASGSKGNCCVIRDKQTSIMIDCGTTKKYLTQAFEKIKFDIQGLDALFITHDHSDHISQLRNFQEYTIYSPIELPYGNALHVSPQKPITINSITVTPLALSHDAPHTTGYIFDNGYEKIVYITDTGYLPEKYYPMLKNATCIVLESNHDVKMLMATNRPQFIKARIYSDEGHLNNDDCATALQNIVSPNTQTIILAHISEQGNDRMLALNTSANALQTLAHKHPKLTIAAAGQYEIITKGENNEENCYGSVYRRLGVADDFDDTVPSK